MSEVTVSKVQFDDLLQQLDSLGAELQRVIAENKRLRADSGSAMPDMPEHVPHIVQRAGDEEPAPGAWYYFLSNNGAHPSDKSVIAAVGESWNAHTTVEQPDGKTAKQLPNVRVARTDGVPSRNPLKKEVLVPVISERIVEVPRMTAAQRAAHETAEIERALAKHCCSDDHCDCHRVPEREVIKVVDRYVTRTENVPFRQEVAKVIEVVREVPVYVDRIVEVIKEIPVVKEVVKEVYREVQVPIVTEVIKEVIKEKEVRTRALRKRERRTAVVLEQGRTADVRAPTPCPCA